MIKLDKAKIKKRKTVEEMEMSKKAKKLFFKSKKKVK